MLDEFAATNVETAEGSIFVRLADSGPPILPLHGLPETDMIWRAVAPLLMDRFTVLCADLRGYGRSGCPASRPHHSAYSKRAMAQELVDVMHQLGWTRFSVAGHDRGDRVAYRLALNHPDQDDRLAVLGVLTTGEVWARADAKLTQAFWPWSLLAQPEPLPERLLFGNPRRCRGARNRRVGFAPATFDADVQSAYVAALKDATHVHAICEEYRAAATCDRPDDDADRKIGRRIERPVLVLWSGQGGLDNWYGDADGPLAIWRAWADHVEGGPVDAGHFFPEELPEQTATALPACFGANK